MDALIPINVVIGDRSYRIRIEPKDEETVRGTVKVINDKIIEYKTQFAGKGYAGLHWDGGTLVCHPTKRG